MLIESNQDRDLTMYEDRYSSIYRVPGLHFQVVAVVTCATREESWDSQSCIQIIFRVIGRVFRESVS